MKHHRLVLKLCRRYQWVDSPSYSYDDLVQDAMLSARLATRDEGRLSCAPSTAAGYAIKNAAQKNLGRMLAPVALPRGTTAGSAWRSEEQAGDVTAQTPSHAAVGPRMRLVLESMPERDRDILWQRFGLGLTLEEVGERYGITRERVRQLESRALERIRTALAVGREHVRTK